MKGKRILSAVLSAALLLQLSPLAAFAEDTLPLSDTATTVQTEPAPEDLAIDAQIAPEPTAETPAEPTAEPTPEASEEPTATPTPEPAAEPTAEPTASPAPEATAEPTAEPTATPDPAAEVQALIDALPDADAVTADTADEVEEQLAAIDEAKATLTDEQLGGLDFARYDAAANALLALWGEATTDAVELLDNGTEPTKEGEWYVIDSVEDLYWLATPAAKNVKAKLTQDIIVNNKVLNDDGSLTSTNLTDWTPITDFAGTLDGDGHTISGLYCNTPGSNYVGLFGSIKGGTVTHLGVEDSYFAGSTYVGSVCGYNNGTISGCYSTATVSSSDVTGGVLVGYNFVTVKNSFAYGTALGSARAFGSNQGTMTNCFYRKTGEERFPSPGTTEATEAQFKSGMVAYQLGSEDIEWQQNLAANGDAYPRFYPGKNDLHVGLVNGKYHNHTSPEQCKTCKLENEKPQYNGSVYLINNEKELKWFSDWVSSRENNANARLEKDIEVTGWTPIGTEGTPFNGTLDGNGKTVTINGIAGGNANNAGLVGYLGSGGKITNIKVAGTVTGGDNVGGVVGYCLGTLENVMNAATVSGTSNVGGVIGYYGATGNASYNLGNTGNVTATSNNPGGVIGKKESGPKLYNSYSTKKQLCGMSDDDAYQNCYAPVSNRVVEYKGEADFASGNVAYLLHQGSRGETWGQNLTADETAPNCLNSPQVFQNADELGYHNHTTGEPCTLCGAVR